MFCLPGSTLSWLSYLLSRESLVMDQAFACPECGTMVEVGGLAPGRQVRCGFCHRLLEVPFLPRVEASGWRRRKFGRPWWVPWAWGGLGLAAAAVIVVAADPVPRAA